MIEIEIYLINVFGRENVLSGLMVQRLVESIFFILFCTVLGMHFAGGSVDVALFCLCELSVLVLF